MIRTAESQPGQRQYHVVRGDRFACGAKRNPDAVDSVLPAHDVAPSARCLRVGCANDYAKADREARR